MKKKILLLSLLMVVNLTADLKFKNANNLNTLEQNSIDSIISSVPELKEKKEIKINPTSNILEILEKETTTTKIKDSSYKIVDVKKLNSHTNAIHKKTLVHINMKNDNYNIIKSDYILESYYWYVIRKNKDGVIKFLKYSPLNEKDFNSYSSYLKIEDANIKLLSKKGNNFSPSIIDINKKITIEEIEPETFQVNRYIITFKGLNYE